MAPSEHKTLEFYRSEDVSSPDRCSIVYSDLAPSFDYSVRVVDYIEYEPEEVVGILVMLDIEMEIVDIVPQ